MSVFVEFINACAWCNKYEGFVKALSDKFENVKVKVYNVGKDFDYIKKYGMITKSTVIINEKVRINDLSEKNILNAVKEEVEKLKWL